MKIQTQVVGISTDDRLIGFVERKLGKLAGLGRPILQAQVTLRKESGGPILDKVMEVSVVVPGRQLYTRQRGQTFEAATEKAVDTLRSQITRYKGRNAAGRRARSH